MCFVSSLWAAPRTQMAIKTWTQKCLSTGSHSPAGSTMNSSTQPTRSMRMMKMPALPRRNHWWRHDRWEETHYSSASGPFSSPAFYSPLLPVLWVFSPGGISPSSSLRIFYQVSPTELPILSFIVLSEPKTISPKERLMWYYIISSSRSRRHGETGVDLQPDILQSTLGEDRGSMEINLSPWVED